MSYSKGGTAWHHDCRHYQEIGPTGSADCRHYHAVGPTIGPTDHGKTRIHKGLSSVRHRHGIGTTNTTTAQIGTKNTTMGTILERTRKDGSKAFTAQIVIQNDGAIAHREAQTFDRKQAANAWIVKREAELKRPGGLERREDPPLSAVIDRYIAESRNPVAGTKAQVLKTIKDNDLGGTKCSHITSESSSHSPESSTRPSSRKPAITTSHTSPASSRLPNRHGAIPCCDKNSKTRLPSSKSSG